MALNAHAATVTAEVVKVERNMIYKVIPYKECRDSWEPVTTIQPHTEVVSRQRRGDPLVGAILGGGVGSLIGKGKGRDAAIVVGAIVGADRYGREEVTTRSTYRTVNEHAWTRKCFERYDREEVQDGYVVHWDFHGIRGQRVMSYEPGPYISVDIEVR
jgi:uncharacterized protein YcfJ